MADNGMVDQRFHVVCPVCRETLEWHFRSRAEAYRYARRVSEEHLHTTHLHIYDTMGPKNRRGQPEYFPTAHQRRAR